MIFIFGVSPKQNVIGPAEERTCAHCNNKRFWLLKKESQWFSLFFIPLIPFSTKYFLQCPICGNAELLSKEDFDQYYNKASLNNDALAGNMNATEYQQKHNDLQ
jgi:hypothetical protein